MRTAEGIGPLERSLWQSAAAPELSGCRPDSNWQDITFLVAMVALSRSPMPLHPNCCVMGAVDGLFY